MKSVFVTQRVDYYHERNEKRDGLDQNLIKFLFQANLLPILIPNNIDIITHYIKNFHIDGIILSGGNDLLKYGGNAPERDQVEYFLLNYAIKNKKPVIGICRGMQIILDYFNISLHKVDNHVKTFHELNLYNQTVLVNSFHNYGVFEIPDFFDILSVCNDDNVIEAIKHKNYSIYGIMWHPERDLPFNNFNINFFRNIFD